MSTETKQNQYYLELSRSEGLVDMDREENSKRGPLQDQRAEALQIRSSMNTPMVGAPCR
jgi:hypothetical protein